MSINRLSQTMIGLFALAGLSMLMLLALQPVHGGAFVPGAPMLHLVEPLQQGLAQAGMGEGTLKLLFAIQSLIDAAGAAALLFALLFWLMGGEAERLEARTLVRGAAALALLAATLVMLASMFTAVFNAILYLQVAMALVLIHLGREFSDELDGGEIEISENHIARTLARKAAREAYANVMTAQVIELSARRRET